ncbi:hypothetical protein GALMADRAFT_244369 [Galerina marginata CBS 339.88]|uniref:Uncharacterized protein n=1 Tax=Galerina marginata (strain CBS 339.88) TaxID=685588 RepID=A0A067T8W5_GALM3|nr:hypothetical protein GALMADRAFT_244369 [Galerina marginata CBS 339.88]
MLNADHERFDSIPRSMKMHGSDVNEDYARPLPEEILGLYNNRMTDEEFDIFSRLDGGVRLAARGPYYDEFYMQSDETDSGSRYFNDEDLFRRLEEEYDYPQGVEEEEDARDAFDEQVLFDDEHTWRDFGERREQDEEDQHIPIALEGAVINVRYFDAKDLYDREDFRNSVYGEEEPGLERQYIKNGYGDGQWDREESSSISTTGSELSPLERDYDRLAECLVFHGA